MIDERKAAGVPRSRPETNGERGGGNGPRSALVVTRRCRVPAGVADAPAEPAALAVRVTHPAGVMVAEVSGEIDLRTADTLRSRLLELVHEVGLTGRDRLIVDLSGVRFCDATGLGALVAAHNEFRGQGGQIHLCRVRPAQRRLLRITRLDRLFPMHDTIADASGEGQSPTPLR